MTAANEFPLSDQYVPELCQVPQEYDFINPH